MNSANSRLLTIFTKYERYGQDVDSLRKRLQNLSLIYVNIGMTILISCYSFCTGFFFGLTSSYFLLISTLAFSASSFFFLKEKHTNLATIALLMELHTSNVVVGFLTNSPLVAIYGMMIYPFFMFALSSSLEIHLGNAVVCFVEFYINAERVLEIFEVTLIDEQRRQVRMLLTAGALCCLAAILISVVQKKIEASIWCLAKENYLKSENLTKEVVQAMEAKDTFISMLSHEIRNPLNALKGSIDFLLQVIKDKSLLQVLQNAKLSGDILLNLVSNVLDAAKLKSDKMEIISMETDIVDTLKKVCTINSEKFREKSLSVDVYIDESVPRFIWIDPSRLIQILMNLLSNAVKFTSQRGRINLYVSWCQQQTEKAKLSAPFVNIGIDGKPDNKINQRNHYSNGNTSGFTPLNSHSEVFDEFNFEEGIKYKKNLQSVYKMRNHWLNDLSMLSSSSWDTQGQPWKLHKTHLLRESDQSPFQSWNEQNENIENKGFLKIQITDTGCGIDENEIHKIFGMFEQATSGSRSVHGGTGLGLWICKQLCQKMHGDINVYSKPGKGASFVLHIPIDNNLIKTETSLNARSGWLKEKVKALVVDDYSVNRYLHKLLLEQEGVQVTVACDGKEAYEKFKTQEGDPYDLIMMDVQMPIMDGFTSAKLIREWEVNQERRKVDIYFVTGEYFNEDEILAGFRNKGGLNENIRFLKKPLDPEILTKMVLQYRRQLR